MLSCLDAVGLEEGGEAAGKKSPKSSKKPAGGLRCPPPPTHCVLSNRSQCPPSMLY